MLKAHYNSAKVLTPTLSIESILDTIFENNTFSEQCTGFFRNMRNWLEKLQEENLYLINVNGFSCRYILCVKIFYIVLL